MAKFEFEYTEIDGVLYPNIEIGGKPTPLDFCQFSTVQQPPCGFLGFSGIAFLVSLLCIKSKSRGGAASCSVSSSPLMLTSKRLVPFSCVTC
ncbi:hypothetical protein ABFV83_18940 [Lacrimispora sp. BS-2]|uniref:Uncharacterized protein n=1 Tax=Lacrimispora sp. BS-2 TaxID=3151850 RepID=A0AAU7PNB4_9FIRM